jgi:hypothetical protein
MCLKLLEERKNMPAQVQRANAAAAGLASNDPQGSGYRERSV